MSKPFLILLVLLFNSCSSIEGIQLRKVRKTSLETKSVQVDSIKKEGKLFSQTEPVFRSSSHLEISEIEKSDLNEDIPSEEQRLNNDKTIVTATSAFDESLKLRYSAKLYNWWINFFTKREKARFNRHLNNGIKYKKLIKNIFKEHGLPADLYYVGLIESGYNTFVRSRAGATGPWQFMRGTAKDYGLRVDRTVDERANLIKATHAAARYFKDLYNIFLSWELVLCAYNAGEYRIIGAIRRGNTRDYRELVKKRLLPKETIYYIPKVAAAKTIIDSPEEHGFKVDYNAKNPYENYQIKNVSYSFDSRKLAKGLKISYSLFRKLNPDIINKKVRVRSKKRGLDILVPTGTKTTLAEAKTLGEFKYRTIGNPNSTRRASTKEKHYRVRRGDNLYKIAKRLGVSVTTLRELNNIKGSKILVGQKLKTKKTIRNTKNIKKRRVASSKKIIVHRVQRGENLTRIAKKYGTTVSTIRALNRSKRKVLYIGQRLRVPANKVDFYTVRRGDNLTKIASKFGVSLGKLKSLNNFRSSRIFIGQKLKVPSKG